MHLARLTKLFYTKILNDHCRIHIKNTTLIKDKEGNYQNKYPSGTKVKLQEHYRVISYKRGNVQNP